MILLAAGLGYLLVGIIALIGVTIFDLRETHWQKHYRAHPYARRYRTRPTLLVDPSTPATQLATLKKEYRKVSSRFPAPDESNVLILQLKAPIQNDTIKPAIIKLISQSRADSIELPLELLPVATLHQLLINYYLIATDFFRKSRQGFGVQTKASSVIIQKRSRTLRQIDIIYILLSSSFRLIVPAVIIGILYTGIVLGATELIALTLVSCCLFMTASIWWHDQLNFRQKLIYLLLSPMSLWYFAGVATTASLEILTHMSKAILHGSISLFMRIKNVLRIVE